MAGIGVRLNRIFEKNTLTTNLVGFFYKRAVFLHDSLYLYLFSSDGVPV